MYVVLRLNTVVVKFLQVSIIEGEKKEKKKNTLSLVLGLALKFQSNHSLASRAVWNLTQPYACDFPKQQRPKPSQALHIQDLT